MCTAYPTKDHGSDSAKEHHQLDATGPLELVLDTSHTISDQLRDTLVDDLSLSPPAQHRLSNKFGVSLRSCLTDGPKDMNTTVDSDGGEDVVMGLPEPYIEICVLGHGANGPVMLARDTTTNTLVAVKQLYNPMLSQERAKSCFRELHLLNCLRHPNIVHMIDAFMDGGDDENNLFLVTEYIQNDLRSVLNEGLRLSLTQIRRIMHQLLQAIAYLHHRGVIHRDLKPENILVSNENDDVRICDLGMARRRDIQMTGYLATRYYRAPEFMLTWQSYGPAVDIWSLGCILAEMATGTLLFPGIDHIHHLKSIMQLVGSPPTSLLERICSPSTRKYVAMLPTQVRVDFQALFAGHLGWEGADLLDRMLTFDPAGRITPTQALLHPFFTGLETNVRHDQLMASEGVPCEHWPTNTKENGEKPRVDEASNCNHSDMDAPSAQPKDWIRELRLEVETSNERRKSMTNISRQ